MIDRLLFLAARNDEFVGRLILLASFLTFGVPPWRLEVLTTTTGLGLTLTTTVGVIDRVHTHTANSRADTLPA